MFEITGEGGLDAEVVEKFDGVTGVFGGDEFGLAQDAHRAGTHVFEIANRGGDEVKRAHAGIVSPRRV